MSKRHRHHPEANAARVDGREKAPEAEVITLTDEMVTSPETQGQVRDLQAQVKDLEAQIKDLTEKLAAKDKEVSEHKDKYLRALADGENARKRIRQQSEESVRLQKEGVLRDLLPIVDNLERAVGAAHEGAGDTGVIVDGVKMVLRSLLDFLKAQGVVPIVSAGQP